MGAKDALIANSSRERGEIKKAGETPTLPASPFRCEETPS